MGTTSRVGSPVASLPTVPGLRQTARSTPCGRSGYLRRHDEHTWTHGSRHRSPSRSRPSSSSPDLRRLSVCRSSTPTTSAATPTGRRSSGVDRGIEQWLEQEKQTHSAGEAVHVPVDTVDAPIVAARRRRAGGLHGEPRGFRWGLPGRSMCIERCSALEFAPPRAMKKLPGSFQSSARPMITRLSLSNSAKSLLRSLGDVAPRPAAPRPSARRRQLCDSEPLRGAMPAGVPPCLAGVRLPRPGTCSGEGVADSGGQPSTRGSQPPLTSLAV